MNEMKVTYENGTYKCISEYKERDIPRSVGFRWSAAQKRWETRDFRCAEKLEQYADEAAKNALKTAREGIQEKIQESLAVDASIEIPRPDGLEYLGYQKAGITYAKTRKGTLIADEMGLGKTIQAIGIINADENLKKVLIVCPASLKINWKRELEKWLVRSLTIRIVDTKDTEITADISIVNYDILKKLEFLNEVEFDLLVADECHYIKSCKAQRTKALLALKGKKKVFLTGTPVMNRPIELVEPLKALGVNLDFWAFAKKYCNARKTRFGWDMKGASNLGELQEFLRSTCMIRRMKKDVLTELPDKIHQIIELPKNGATRLLAAEEKYMKDYEEMKKALSEAKKKAKEQKDDKAYNDAVGKLRDVNRVAFTEISRLRHGTALAKVQYVVEHIQGMVDEGIEKVVLFAHHTDVIANICEGLEKAGIKHVRFVGADSQEKRQQSIDAFQSDATVQVFIGSIAAAGVGITLTQSSNVVFAELDWTPAAMRQAEDRCHRLGQKNSVLVQHIVFDGSIDAMLAKTLIKKQQIISESIDADNLDNLLLAE